MSVKDRITAKLAAALAPISLTVIDESAQHAGHIGHQGSGHPGELSSTETHFAIKIVSTSFAGKSRLDRHRVINAILADELKSGVHALAIDARAAGE